MIGKLDGKRVAVAIQGLHLARNANMGTELLCLDERAAREILPCDASGEPQIVLDAGTRTCLPPRCTTVEYRGGQAIG
ncbi:hypothetical protein D9M69_706610 [compost metagenome]